jgi:hypothetical protein
MSGTGSARRGKKASSSESLHGRWRIVWMSGWDQDYVDMEVPGHFTFASGRSGSFQFGLVQAQMDCRIRAGSNPPYVEFTWHGSDEGDELTGRGHAKLVGDELHGHLYIHLGDDSAFRAVRQAGKSVTRRRNHRK